MKQQCIRLVQRGKLPLTCGIVFLSSMFHLFAVLLRTEIANNNPVISRLAVSPSNTLMGGKVWTLLTASLVEENTFKFMVFIACVGFAVRELEKEIGTVSATKLVLLSQTIASLVSTLVFFATYFFTLNDQVFFSHVFGLGGILVAATVGIAKRMRAGRRVAILPGIALYALLGLQFPLYDALLVVLTFPPAVYMVCDNELCWRMFVSTTAGNSSANAVGQEQDPPSALAVAAADPAKERFRARGFKLLDKKLAELEAAPEVSLDDPQSLA